MKENPGVGMSRTCARCKAAFEGPNGRWMGVCNASCARNSRAHRQACHPPTARRSPLSAVIFRTNNMHCSSKQGE